MSNLTNLESKQTIVYEKVITLELCKLLRAYLVSEFKEEKTNNFLTKTLAYFVYDNMLQEKNKHIKITKVDLKKVETNYELDKNKNYLLLYLGSRINSQINPAEIYFSSNVSPAEKSTTYSIPLTSLLDIPKGSKKLTVNFTGTTPSPCFAIFEYENKGEDLDYFPRENEFFLFLVSKPTRANHFPSMDSSSSMSK